jgi:hypothetical protein
VSHEASSSGVDPPYAAFAENSRGKFRSRDAPGNQFFSMQAQAGTGCVEVRVYKMGDVTTLRPREVVRQDVEAIAVVYRNLGAPVAEQMVTRALGELALTMAGIAEKVRSQELRDLARQLGRLGRLAGDLGLVSLATVAVDAKTCLERADGTAFSAVWARLLRVAERSLVIGPEVSDQSI